MTTYYYYIVKASVKDQPEFVYMVLPGLRLVEETRTVDAILDSAAAKGHDVAYVGVTQYGVPRRYAEEIRQACVRRMRAKYPALVKSEWDVEVDICNRITVLK